MSPGPRAAPERQKALELRRHQEERTVDDREVEVLAAPAARRGVERRHDVERGGDAGEAVREGRAREARRIREAEHARLRQVVDVVADALAGGALLSVARDRRVDERLRDPGTSSRNRCRGAPRRRDGSPRRRQPPRARAAGRPRVRRPILRSSATEWVPAVSERIGKPAASPAYGVVAAARRGARPAPPRRPRSRSSARQ